MNSHTHVAGLGNCDNTILMHTHILKHPERVTLRKPEQEKQRIELAKAIHQRVLSYPIDAKPSVHEEFKDQKDIIDTYEQDYQERITDLQTKLSLLKERKYEKLQELKQLIDSRDKI